MARGVGEWIETTLGQVISFYPQYENFDLYIWDDSSEEGELYFLGRTSEVLNKYEHNNVFITDEQQRQIWLEGTAKEIGLDV